MEIDGLKPLTKEATVEFEDGSEALVTLEYHKLEKHCSHCFKLSHEVELCPTAPRHHQTHYPKKNATTRQANHLKPPYFSTPNPNSLAHNRHKEGDSVGEATSRRTRGADTTPDSQTR
ncbi:unnamed protein product [Microthlaspi erraticum]|uniref:Zinc knuckle CX2CX4HX4C domain-containing protein n=1 Tax=Microthlaspi erraticum TaxID=1685480 RepID=A0A6D2LEX2_9BRAS|nr:unnamed protein product [Microthlaspi erraticum]